MKTRGRSLMPEITQTARMVREDCIRPSCKTRAPMYVPSPRLLSYSQTLNFVADPALLKRNKYVGILSIAVTTLQYITISMITIFSMYIAHVR